jgi:hypothetical protein
MGLSVFPAPAAGKTRFLTTLTSGTSYTVPAGVTYLNVTLQGGGAGGASGTRNAHSGAGQMISSTLSTTPGASISYSIGGGGSGAAGGGSGAGGTTTFTGATSAGGGNGVNSGSTANAGTSAAGYPNQGLAAGESGYNGGGGGSGRIDIEYWV